MEDADAPELILTSSGIGAHVSWRWESMDRISNQLLDKLELAANYFKKADFSKTTDDAVDIEHCAAAIVGKDSFFLPWLHVIGLWQVRPWGER